MPTGPRPIAIPRPNLGPLRQFLAHGVDLIVAGGHAVAYHGFPRNTENLDLWVRADHDNLKKLDQAFQKLGYTPDQASILYRNQVVLEMGIRPFAIQILKAVSGLQFADAVRAALVCAVVDTDLTVKVIGLEDLRANKAASGRGKDLIDLENLPQVPEL